jgi:hypothetical protein
LFNLVSFSLLVALMAVRQGMKERLEFHIVGTPPGEIEFSTYLQ